MKFIFTSLFIVALTLAGYTQTGGTTLATAAPISCGSTFSGSTAGSGGDGYVNCGTEGTGGQRWFSFTAPGSGSVLLSLCTGTGYDSRIHVYADACGAITCVGGDDDACNGANTLASEYGWNVTGGTTYYIRIGGFLGASGNFTATFTCNIPPVGGCNQVGACNFNPLATFDNGTCDYSCFGCTYAAASNYSPVATIDDGSCLFNVVADGCTDPEACNYCNLCANDDGSCDYACLGCTYANAANYNASATRDDGSCEFAGCTDPAALNYSAVALVDDGSCTFEFVCEGDINNDGIIGIGDLIIMLANFGFNCPN